jgi:F0F1-type ATP synthase assembly protein I
MKLLRPHLRVNTQDSLGQGLDAAITLVVFFGIGYVVDRWLGTTPWFMIAFTLLAAVGLFYKLKAGYENRMDELDATRRALRQSDSTQAAPK